MKKKIQQLIDQLLDQLAGIKKKIQQLTSQLAYISDDDRQAIVYSLCWLGWGTYLWYRGIPLF